MSRFAEAIIPVFKREGRYSNDPDDPGQETCWGISRRSNPDWPGWEIVDSAKQNGQPLEQFDATLQLLAGELYQANYWVPAYCDRIEDQRLAEYVFDIAVNHGVAVALTVWQSAMLPTFQANIELTFLRLIMARIVRYVKIVTENPSRIKYLLGWLNRALYPLKGD